MPPGGARYDKDGKLLTGRKPNKIKKVPYGTKVREDHRDWLKKQDNACDEIELALDNHILYEHIRKKTPYPTK